MNKSNLNIDQLIGAFLSGDISKEDLKFLESWKDASLENKIEFDQYKLLWERSSALKLFNCVNAKQDWLKIKDKCCPANSNKVIKYQFNFIRKIAAVLLPTILVGSIAFSLYWTTPGFGRWSQAKATDTIKEVVLPDSSIILLNKNSKIRYRNSIKKDSTRTVNLLGEAFFKVSHDKQRAFIVTANEVSVSVLGTEFNVNQTEDDIYVSVLTGKVKVEADNQHSILLTDGEKAIFEDGLLSESNTSAINDFYWHSKKLEFNQATLSDICKSLQEVYPEIKTISFKATKSDIKITTSFDKQSLKEIIEELHLHFEKKFTLNGTVLTISD